MTQHRAAARDRRRRARPERGGARPRGRGARGRRPRRRRRGAVAARCGGSTSTSCCSTTRSAPCRCSTSRASSPSSFPEVGLVLIAADDSPELLRAAMQAGLRDVVALPLSLESASRRSVRAASQWSRTMRDRVTGEESAGGGARRPADRRRRLQGRRRHHHRRAAPRARRRRGWRPAGRSASSTSTSRRATSARFLDTPLPAQRGRPRRGRRRDLRPPPAGDAVHAQGRLPACCSRPTRASAPRRSTRWPRGRSCRRSRRATR